MKHNVQDSGTVSPSILRETNYFYTKLLIIFEANAKCSINMKMLKDYGKVGIGHYGQIWKGLPIYAHSKFVYAPIYMQKIKVYAYIE